MAAITAKVCGDDGCFLHGNLEARRRLKSLRARMCCLSMSYDCAILTLVYYYLRILFPTFTTSIIAEIIF